MATFDRRPAVFQHNSLIDCKNRTMNEKQTKLYYLGLRKAVSDLPKTSEAKRPTFTRNLLVEIHEAELISRFGKKWVENDLRKEALQMMKATIKVKIEKGWGYFNVFSFVVFQGGKLQIKFSDDIAPLVYDLTGGCFTKVPLDDIMKLKSVYSIRLLELMLKVINGSQKRKFTYEDLREMLNVKENDYTRMDSFKKKVLDEPIKDINDNTQYLLDYKPTKTGRKITGFDMTIKQKTGAEKKEQAQEKKKISAVVASLIKIDDLAKVTGVSDKDYINNLRRKYNLTNEQMIKAIKEAKKLKK